MQAPLLNTKTSDARRRSDDSYRSFVEDSEFLQDMDSSYDAKSTTSEEAVAALTPSSAISSPIKPISTAYRQHSPKGPPSISNVLNSPLSAKPPSQSDVSKARPPPLQAPFNYRKSSMKLRSPPDTSPKSFVSPLSAPSSSSTVTPSFSSPRKGNISSPRMGPKSPKSTPHSPRKHRINALSDSPLPDSPTIPTAGSNSVPSFLSIPPSLRPPTSPKKLPRKENAQKKRFTRTLGHISAFIPINVCISESLTMAVTVEKTKTVEQLARQIEAEYTFKHYDVDGPDLTPLEVGLLYDEGMVALRFRDVVGDILDVGTTVHVLNVYEHEDDSEKTPTSSAHSMRTSSISAVSSAYASSERSRRRSSLPISFLMTPSMLDALPPSPPPIPSGSIRHGSKHSISEIPPRLVRSLSQSDVSLYANSDHLAMAGLDTRFRDILANKLALRYFARFALAEFSVENLLFYIDVELFSSGQALAKDLDDEEFYDDISRDDPDYAATVQAEFIYVCYIADNAPLQVNLPDEIRRDIVDPRELLLPDRTMFDEAQEAVFQLMKGHTYVRFETHEMYRQLFDIRKNDPKRFRSNRISEDDYIHIFQPNIPMMLAMNTTLADPNTVVSAHYREQLLTSALSQYFPEGDPLADIPPSPAIIVEEGSRPPSAGADVATLRPAPSPLQSDFSVSDPDMQPQEVEGYFEEDNHLTTAQKVRKMRRRKKLQWIFGETVQGTRNSTPGSAYSAMSSSLDLQDAEEESDDTDDLAADIDEQDSILRHRIAKQIFEKKRQMDKVEAVLGAAPGRISEKGRSSAEDQRLPSPKLRLGALKAKKKGNEEIGIAYSDDSVPTARRIVMNRASHLFEPPSPTPFNTLTAKRFSGFPTTRNDLSADQRRLLWKKNRKLRVLLGQALDEDVVQAQLTRAAFVAPEQFEKAKTYEPSMISTGSISIKNEPMIPGHSRQASNASARPTLHQLRKRRSSDPQLYSSSPSPTKSGFDDIAPAMSALNNSGSASVAPVQGYGSSRDTSRARPLAIRTAPSIDSFGTLNTDGTMMSAASNSSFRSTERLLGEGRTPHSPSSPSHRYTHSQPIYLSSAPSPRTNDASGKMFTLPEIEHFPSMVPFPDQSRDGQTQAVPPSSPFESEAEAKEYRRRKMEKLYQFYGERVPMSAAGVPLGNNGDSSNNTRHARSHSHSGGGPAPEGLDEYAERGRGGADTAAYYSSMVTSPIQGEYEHKDKEGLFNRWRMRKRSNPSPSRGGVVSQNSAHSTSSGSTASAKFDTWRSTDSLWQPHDAQLVRGDINAEQERVMRSRFLNATPRKLTRKTSSTSTSPILQMGGIGRSPGGQ